MSYRGYDRISDRDDLSGEGYAWPDIEPTQITHRLIRHYDDLGVGFFKGTEIIAEVPIKAVRAAIHTLTILTKLIPASTITLNLNDNLDLVLFKYQGEPEILVYLKDAKRDNTLWQGDLEDIDPFQ